MTLSEDERRRDAWRLMGRLLDGLGDQFYNEFDIDPESAEWAGFLRTSWSELHERVWIIRDEASGYLRLSNVGWLEINARLGRLDQPAFRQRVDVLMAAVKGFVKGRDDAEFVSYREVVEACDLPEGWVLNALHSDICAYVHRDRNCSVWLDETLHLNIPANFGQRRLEL